MSRVKPRQKRRKNNQPYGQSEDLAGSEPVRILRWSIFHPTADMKGTGAIEPVPFSIRGPTVSFVKDAGAVNYLHLFC